MNLENLPLILKTDAVEDWEVTPSESSFRYYQGQLQGWGNTESMNITRRFLDKLEEFEGRHPSPTPQEVEAFKNSLLPKVEAEGAALEALYQTLYERLKNKKRIFKFRHAIEVDGEIGPADIEID